jgi:hypothetical protein
MNEQYPSREKELQPNPGVQTPESMQSAQNETVRQSSQTGDIPTAIPAPDPNPEAIQTNHDNLTATEMNPIEERAASQNTKYMVIIAVVAVVVIVLALLYMWGSRVAQERELYGGDTITQEGEETMVGDQLSSEQVQLVPTQPPVVPTAVAEEEIALPELSEIDTEFAELEAELDALLVEEPLQ